MTALLVALTFAALGLAGALLFYVLRISREQRDRSDARAAALSEMIGETGSSGSLGSPGSSGASFAASEWDVSEVPDAIVRAPMFGSASVDVEEGGPRMWLVPAIGVLVVGLALTGVYLWNKPATAAAASPVSSAPLELLSLRHQRQGDLLIVSGLVRNPHAGRPFARLSAVAFTFDRQGTFLASGRAAIDFPQLAAGDESPFSISVPQSTAVGRYRVSFRTEESVVPHVDRRESPAGSPASAQVTK